MSAAPRRRPLDRSDEADLAIDAKATAQILTKFIKSEVQRAGMHSVVLGLSGGIDSAVAAYLAVRALGPEHVHCLLMPYRTSTPASEKDAGKIVEELSLPFETIDITPAVEGFIQVTGDAGRRRLGNVMARQRMIVLFDRSAQHESLVLGTSNKTELLLGYGTLHGDLASAINPLGDLYKTQVRELAEFLNVPTAIREKLPSADLWPDQADEDELGFEYEVVDRLLALLVDARVSRETAVAAGFEAEMVDRVTRMIMRTQFKRRPPVIAKVSRRSIGWDFRYPRDWMS